MADLRPDIIRAHQIGRGVREIARFLDIPVMTVSDAIKRFEESGSNKDRPGRGRKKTARSKENILRFKRMIKHPRTKSLRETSLERGIPETSVEEGLERNHTGYPGQDRG
jgi:transposase